MKTILDGIVSFVATVCLIVGFPFVFLFRWIVPPPYEHTQQFVMMFLGECIATGAVILSLGALSITVAVVRRRRARSKT